MPGILGKKIGMSRIIIANGDCVPVTYIQVLANEVVQLKNKEKDGYSAIAVGVDPYSKPSKNKRFKFVRELRVDDSSLYSLGQKLELKDLGECSEVAITAVSKGKGFQGPVKRWNRRVARKSHGTKYIRHGSTMSSAITGRSKPGIKMAGRMGGDTLTLKKRSVLSLRQDKNICAIKGPVPGPSDGLVIIHAS
ncbi:50S ribosomal protein L3 [Candidatus Peregrinibacteria bacterium]|jgi:large subunit ribosomal protein L3|nr:50S ribosomal protein L3 [Candidatus Peregrinibacteria bacterium]